MQRPQAKIDFYRGVRALTSSALGAHVVTVGAFDGVHLGHQQLLAGVKAEAQALALPSLAIIFEPQPNEFFQKELAPARLMRLREKVAALAEQGIDRVLCLKFDASLRALSAEDFVQKVLLEAAQCRALIVGDDFRFGCDRSGDFAFLQARGRELGFSVSDTQTHEHEAERISSTRLRALLANGELEQASLMLGRAYSNCGRVSYGQQLGRSIGFPTANVALARRKIALQGVFAVELEFAGTYYNAVANVGTRPTVDGKSKARLEVHVLDHKLDLYGAFVKVNYLYKIRDEQKFDGIESLKKQISLDADAARAFFARRTI
ncbi:bifunctional riboflavin kinase/FAD synthetase [Agaribacterium haliotis]|uniref:bifunctional riboflavin kinase/FAD synthetase n=1 Tax=Agaribacterium haliotis TaxID=2013869 RepID=UPI000BB55C76|nr:bifunctional riboflavin kinase/FAD synthetase [Agaribacterium haliotis]